MAHAPSPTLILIHGATLNGAMWHAVRRHLTVSYRVLAPDLPGHGSRRGEAFTLQQAVSTIVAAAASVAPAPVLLAGDSLGGYTAMASAAALPPPQLKGLMLGGCSANLSGAALLPFVLRKLVFKASFAVFGEQRIINERVPKLLRGMGLEEQDTQPMLDAGISLAAFPQAVDELRGIDFRSRLAAVAQPVLIVNGSRDKGMVRQEPAFIAAARQAASYRFEGAEHGVSMLRAAEFAAQLEGFAARCFAA